MQTFKLKKSFSYSSRTVKLRKKLIAHVQNAFDIKKILTYRQTNNQSVRDYIYNSILKRYYPILINEVRNKSIYGYEFEDLLQEARLVLFELIHKSYKVESKNPFWYFLRMCVRRQLYSLISQSRNTKSILLNMSSRFEDTQTDSEGAVQMHYKIMPKVQSHENLIVEKMFATYVIQQLRLNLSEIEFKSYFEKNVNDLTYKQITQKYGYATKGIDNAINRVKRKLRNTMSRIESQERASLSA
ncbi:MAG: sigma factor [Desulfitobacterium hafniense]|nr:sigma factor [Desulfitobacterium hafniense]